MEVTELISVLYRKAGNFHRENFFSVSKILLTQKVGVVYRNTCNAVHVMKQTKFYKNHRSSSSTHFFTHKTIITRCTLYTVVLCTGTYSTYTYHEVDNGWEDSERYHPHDHQVCHWLRQEVHGHTVVATGAFVAVYIGASYNVWRSSYSTYKVAMHSTVSRGLSSQKYLCHSHDTNYLNCPYSYPNYSTHCTISRSPQRSYTWRCIYS